jgi:hypothetical protein
MQIDAFIFKLLLLSIPGFISYVVYRKTAVYRRASKNQFGFAEVFIVVICSLAICFIYDLFTLIISCIRNSNHENIINKLINAGKDNIEIYNALEMGLLCVIAVVLGFILSLFENKRIINKMALKAKITQYTGDLDVWTAFCANENTKWIYVRDHKLNLIYFGYLEQYSDPGEERELLLKDVSVFSDDSVHCYDCPVLYICRRTDDITLELFLDGEGEKNAEINEQAMEHSANGRE